MRTTLDITGMTCQHCVQAVFTALTPVAGIRSADVSIGRVVVEHDGRATEAALREAIAVAGYAVARAHDASRHLPLI